jgi:hypothetical protein
MKTVVLGQPLAGKATCVAALARALGGRLQQRDLANPDHPLGVERALGFTLAADRFHRAFWTISGTPWLSGSWSELVGEAHNAIFVLDAQPDREAGNVEALEQLSGKLWDPDRCRVVVTKADRVGVAEAWRQRDRLLRGTPQAAWPTFVHTPATSDFARARHLVPRSG